MELYTNNYYSEDINNVCKLSLPWNELRGKSIMLSGATGLIGSFFVDVISEKNITDPKDGYLWVRFLFNRRNLQKLRLYCF